MFNRLKKSRAFTLAEIFIAMVILSVLVSVCIAFFSNKKDYEREYFYYSAYKNIQDVVDAALLNTQYLKVSTTRVEETDCGTTASSKKCRAFKADNSNLCNIFTDYFNTTGTSNCSNAVGNSTDDFTNSAFKLTNGMEFYFETVSSGTISPLSTEALKEPEKEGWVIWVDINGSGHGEDTKYYDIMPFYITRSGKVVPGYGEVTGIRGYEPSCDKSRDAAGNSSLMAFDVVYTVVDSNVLSVLSDGRSVSFAEAACKSGYISDAVPYCSNISVTKDGTDCNNAYVDCQIRLVKKLKRVK